MFIYRKSSRKSNEDRRANGTRRLRFETIEERQMLSVTTLSSDSLVSDDVAIVTASTTEATAVTTSSEETPSVASTSTATASTTYSRQMEYLDRGVVVVSEGSGTVYVGWRFWGTDSSDTVFNIYRSTAGGTAVKLNSSAITSSTNYIDNGVDTTKSNTYFVRAVVGGVETEQSESYTLGANASAQQYLGIPLQIPAGVTTPDGVTCTYSANDCSVADLDGDGAYEILVKWDPSNAKDNSQSGYTGNVYLDAYEMDGTLLWRIDLGINIRAGAHYTQFLAYDFDGDGRAEVVCRTAPYTVDGKGAYVLMSGDSLADYRNSSGYILSGPEYLTVFDGMTGAALATTDYLPERGTVSKWGDSYGNRVDRFLACVAYLDGVRPSIVMCRGYYYGQSSYAKNFVVAWNWRDGKLTEVWSFEAAVGQDSNVNSAYVGQGFHYVTAADVDGDGKDEIVYGACVIDDNGKGLYSTGLGHGDAMHVGDFDLNNSGLEIFEVHESASSAGIELHDAATGTLLASIASTGDVGRGVCDDIDPDNPGAEFWCAGSSYLYDCDGNSVGTVPSSCNFLVWWDSDTTRELLNGTTITNYSESGETTLLSAGGCSSNNGSKSTPCLVADIFGDWREEVIWRSTDSTELRIYTTVNLSMTRIYTLMHDSQYRQSVANQNCAYNQPTHTSFYLGTETTSVPTPNIYVVYSSLTPPDAPTSVVATVVSSAEAKVTWAAVTGAASYVIKRSDNSGGPYTTIAQGVTDLSYSDTTVASGGKYYYVVSAVNSSGASDNSAEAAIAIPLISPWVSADLGAVGVAGNATYSGGIFTVTASNASSGGSHFVYQGVVGDSTLICKVATQSSSTGASGLVIQSSTSATAPYASIVAALDGKNHIFFYYRTSDGGTIKYAYAYQAIPVWLKLVRSGSNFSGYYSADGTTWTLVKTVSITMNSLAYGGLTAWSDGANITCVTTFSDVSVTSANVAPTVGRAASASPSVTTGSTTALSVVGADDGGEANLVYAWSATGPGAVSFSANGTNSAKSTVATFTQGGVYVFLVTIRDTGGLTITSSVTVTVSATVLGRYVIYNGSKFDSSTDSAAIATDKSALLPGATATFSNVTSYEKGVNGIIIDVKNLAYPNALSAADFTFRVGDEDDVSAWATAPTPKSISVEKGAGVNGSYRITIVWADGAIKNQWLHVILKATTNTGLASADAFYFGNLVGESGDDLAISAADESAARTNRTGFSAAAIANRYDFNRDGKVNATDELIARNNLGEALTTFVAPTTSAPTAVATTSSALSATAMTGSQAVPSNALRLAAAVKAIEMNASFEALRAKASAVFSTPLSSEGTNAENATIAKARERLYAVFAERLDAFQEVNSSARRALSLTSGVGASLPLSAQSLAVNVIKTIGEIRLLTLK